MNLLLELGAQPQSPDNTGQTPLAYASAFRDSEIVKLLLDRDVEIEFADKNGRTALSIAAEPVYFSRKVLTLIPRTATDVCHYRGLPVIKIMDKAPPIC